MITASGNEVEKYWPTLFANLLKSRKVSDLLSNIGGGAAGPAESTAQETAGETKEEAKKEEEEDEDNMDGAMNLFGDDDW